MLRRIAKWALNRAGYTLMPARHDGYPLDFEASDIEIDQAVRRYTMTPPVRIYSLLKAVDYVAAANIQGAFVECGVWRGGSMMAVATRWLRHGQPPRDLYLYDTFEGMTAPEQVDIARDGIDASRMFERTKVQGIGSDWCRANMEQVHQSLASTGYDASRIHLVRGPVEETLPNQAPQEPIAILRLDTDWYASTKHELDYLYPKLVSGGVLILDDYGYWEGCRRAVDEYLASLPRPVLLQRIDDNARMIIKP